MIERVFLTLSIFFLGFLYTEFQDLKTDLKPLYRMSSLSTIGKCYYDREANLEYMVMVKTEEMKHTFHIWPKELICKKPGVCNIYSMEMFEINSYKKMTEFAMAREPVSTCGLYLLRRHAKDNEN